MGYKIQKDSFLLEVLLKRFMWQLFKILNLYYLLATSFIWFSFQMPRYFSAVNLGMIVCLAFSDFKLIVSKRSLLVLILIIITTIFSSYLIDSGYGMSIFYAYFPAFLLYILPRNKKYNLLEFITKWYALLLLASMIAYLFSMVGLMPSFGIFKAGDLDYGNFENYLFFIRQIKQQGIIYRFNGPFLEPGHQAMISGIILYANKFKIKKNRYLTIILIAIIISFSLAGYVILFLGFAFLYIKSLSKISVIVAFTLIGYFIVTEVWNEGENPVNELIVKRLEYDEDKGIKGNNRTWKSVDEYYEKCLRNGTLVFGNRTLKEDKNRFGGAGYKVFLLRYGIISLILIASLYLLLINPKSQKRYSLFFFVLISLIFLQRAYPSWYSWLLPYTLGCGIYYKKKTIKYKIIYEGNVHT